MSTAPGHAAPTRDPHASPARYLSASIPGVGGVIKQRPEDFLVDEIPAYEPCGEGEHVYLLIQKRGLATFELVDIIARHFGVRRMDVGFAGLKDKHAITRQVVSVHVPGKRAEDFPALEHERIQVLWVDRHANKLRPGHLKGNRFSIRIRGVNFASVRDAHRTLDLLEHQGVPNRVGEQRFGLLGNNHDLGAALINEDHERFVALLVGPCAARPGINSRARELFAAGDLTGALAAFPPDARAERTVLRELIRGKPAKRAVLAIDRAVKSFYVSAFQSAVFNAVLDQRIASGRFHALEPGDLAFKHENGAVFAVDEALAADASTGERLTRLEISPSGPMWGGGMTRASGAVDATETAALAAAGVPLVQVESFSARVPGLVEGKRRPLRVPLANPDIEAGVDEHGQFIRVAFDLPRGAFATAVLPEIMKVAPATGEDDAIESAEDDRAR